VLKREYQRLRRYLPQPQRKGRVDQDRIDRAKEYSILQLAEEGMMNTKKCGRAYRSLCPYHDEKTASFYLYPENNTFHCFGCEAHGDVISLSRRLFSFDFIESVKRLTPYEK
jgi:DNA primase